MSHSSEASGRGFGEVAVLKHLSAIDTKHQGRNGYGAPILSKFGDARIGDVHEGLIQPDIYRAPEVILGKQWTSKVDTWNVGTLVCNTRSRPEVLHR